MGFTDYWTFGVRHIQVLLLVSCMAVDQIILSSINTAMSILETESKAKSNYTLYEDTFKSTLKSWKYHKRNSLINARYITMFASTFLSAYLSTKWNLKMLLIIYNLLLSVQTYIIPTLGNMYGFNTLFGMSMLQGFFYGGVFPLVAAIVGKWIPYTEICRSMTLIVSGTHLGSFVLMVLSGFLKSSVGGWNSLFYISGNIGILWCVAWFTFGFQDPHGCFYISNEEKFYIEKLTHDIHYQNKNLKIPWKEIFTCIPFYGLILESACTVWIYEFLNNLRNLYTFTYFIHGPQYIVIQFFYLGFPVLIIVFQLIVASVVDILIIKGSLPVIHLRKTCNTIVNWLRAKVVCTVQHSLDPFNSFWLINLYSADLGLWGSCVCLVFLGYSKEGYNAVTFYLLSLVIYSFVHVGSLITHFDLSPNFVGLTFGISRGCGLFMTVPLDAFSRHMIINQGYAPGWNGLFYTGALCYLVGNYFYITMATADLQKFNRVAVDLNAAYYCQLLESTKAAYRNKRRDLPIRDAILLHDNARPHTPILTRDKLEEIHWETLDHKKK